MKTYTCEKCGKDRLTETCKECGTDSYNIEIAQTVRVNVNHLEDGRIVYQLESALFDRWIPCGNCTEYTNVPAV